MCIVGHIYSEYLFLIQLVADVLKRCLEITGDYDLILKEGDWELLTKYVKLLNVFDVFTAHVQARNYPTMNTLILFRSEIMSK